MKRQWDEWKMAYNICIQESDSEEEDEVQLVEKLEENEVELVEEEGKDDEKGTQSATNAPVEVPEETLVHEEPETC